MNDRDAPINLSLSLHLLIYIVYMHYNLMPQFDMVDDCREQKMVNGYIIILRMHATYTHDM